MNTLRETKKKRPVSREDIAELLKSIAPPGKKQDEKIKAVQELNKSNRQGHDISITLHSYEGF